MQTALRQGGVGGADLVRGRKPFSDRAVVEDPKEKPDASAEAARLGAQLLKAQGDRQEQLLNQLRDSKGAPYTQALAAAIPKLEGDTLKKARNALAERLSRMTSDTLAGKLEDDAPEVRRAAALAVAMKEDHSQAYKLIELLSDPEATVARAAHAALKELTKEDYGPAKDASREERGKAIQNWKAWWARQREEKK